MIIGIECGNVRMWKCESVAQIAVATLSHSHNLTLIHLS
jgi:hypothetical protein